MTTKREPREPSFCTLLLRQDLEQAKARARARSKRPVCKHSSRARPLLVSIADLVGVPLLIENTMQSRWGGKPQAAFAISVAR